MEAGQDQAWFWEQTPRSFQAVLEGAARRDRRAKELAMFTAFQVVRIGRDTPPRSLDQYLKEVQPPEPKAMAARRTLSTIRALKAQAAAGER